MRSNARSNKLWFVRILASLPPCSDYLNALSAEEVARCRDGLSKTEAHLGVPLAQAEGKYNHNLHLLRRWTDELVRHPAILDVIESLMGPN